MTRQEKSEEIAEKAELNVEERILDLLLPPPRSATGFGFDADTSEESTEIDGQRAMSSSNARAKNSDHNYAAANSTIVWLNSKSREELPCDRVGWTTRRRGDGYQHERYVG